MSLAVMFLAVCLAPGEDVYLQEVKPVLLHRCASCHGALKAKAGLRVDTASAILRGGDSGAAIEPNNSADSILFERITAVKDGRMPPEGEPLTAAEIAAVKRWIDTGAHIPTNELVPPSPQQHWSFQPPVRSPRLSTTANVIDAYFSTVSQEKRLQPQAESSRQILLRRVTFDLTGLVPTTSEMSAFLGDPSSDAYEKAVDRLLASPQYGERWARHWMDVWRYSDWDGFGAEIRESRPFIWHWRDWIVESLNEDTSYARMLTLMLAADEAEPDNDRSQRASGFLARNWSRFNRNVWLENTVEHTAKAFLGLTVNCARCHDHKYDPISQQDYYRFRAFFEPHDVREDQLPIGKEAEREGVPRAYDSKLTEPTYLFVKGDERSPDKSRTLAPGLPTFLSALPLPIAPIEVTPLARFPHLRSGAKSTYLAVAQEAVKKAREALKAAKSEEQVVLDSALTVVEAKSRALEARIQADEAKLTQPPGPEVVPLAMRAKRAEARVALREAEQKLLISQSALAKARRGDIASVPRLEAEFASNAAAVSTQFANLSSTATDYSPAGTVYPTESSGRRLALARWIASATNPLTARVAVNHIWMRHFGRPLVASPSDFGLNGSRPAHVELLDSLAVAFMESGWSQKSLHRLIVTSSVYRRDSSDSNSGNLAIDPENTNYWKMIPRRMEAEAVRDNLIHVAGGLDLKLGGPDLDPSTEMTSTRRSLYLRHSQEKRSVFLRVFDSPNVVECYRRAETVMPHQALALANSAVSHESAKKLAIALKDIKTDQDFIAAAFERVLNRGPSDDERIACEEFLRDSIVRAGQDPAASEKARSGLVHVLFNHTDFVTIR